MILQPIPLYGDNRAVADLLGISLAAFMARPHGLRWATGAPQPLRASDGARPMHFLPAWVGFSYEIAGQEPPPYGMLVSLPTPSEPHHSDELHVKPPAKRCRGRPRKQFAAADVATG